MDYMFTKSKFFCMKVKADRKDIFFDSLFLYIYLSDNNLSILML